MKTLWKKLSDTYKISISMLLLIVLIQLSTLIYIWKFESKVLLDKERKNLSYALHQEAKDLEKHLNGLKKELKFLSSLELMDDVLVSDVDKRVTILLEKKAKDLAEGIVLVATDTKRVVASSIQEYRVADFLKIEVALFASFDRKKKIGELQLLYPLKNLADLTMHNPHYHLWLSSFPKEEYANRDIVVSQKIDILGKEERLFLSYEKEYALKSLKKIEKILFVIFMISLFLLLFVVWTLSKRQVKILEHTKEVLALKRTFLSTMSHELRTPLGSILNLTQHLMVSPNIKDDEVDMLGRIENASEHLLGMINNLLQLSKLESNAMVVKQEKINLVETIEEMLELVEPLIEEKSLVLKREFSIKNADIKSDVNLFKQVVMNLLSNAIKFTNRGSIEVLLVELDKEYRLSVKDTGVGIEKERQKELFSEFYQAHIGESEIKHSTGLGLALSQKVAKLIGGNIEIFSEGRGKGVTATFSFISL